jgi:hypothetical protein
MRKPTTSTMIPNIAAKKMGAAMSATPRRSNKDGAV